MPQSGVYLILHTSGKCYIGSGVNIMNRWSNHRFRLRHNQHYAPHLQNAWNKYGEDAFAFLVLLYCDPENCVMYEQIALDHFKPEYNTCKTAGNGLGRKHSDVSKRKISNSNKGKHNIRHSKSTKRLISDAMSGERHPRARLSSQDILSIRKMLSEGTLPLAISQLYGIHRATVSKIKHHKLWRHQ